MNWAALFPTQPLANSAKSTVLHSLGWMMLMLFAGLVSCAIAKVPEWMLIVIAVMLAINFLIYCGSYIYFAVHNPELLRTEQFVLRRLEIEHRITGDSDSGIIEGEVLPDQPVIARPTRRIGSSRQG